MSSDGAPGSAAVSGVLVVCRANRCRSPLVTAVAQHAFGDDISVVSRGLSTRVGLEATVFMARAASALGYDLADHRSHPLVAADVEVAPLVLTMEAVQRVELIHAYPDRWHRIFALGEIVRLLAGRTRDDDLPMNDLRGRIEAMVIDLADVRTLSDALSLSPVDDVVDPTGSGRRTHEVAARRMIGLVGALAGYLCGFETAGIPTSVR